MCFRMPPIEIAGKRVPAHGMTSLSQRQTSGAKGGNRWIRLKGVVPRHFRVVGLTPGGLFHLTLELLPSGSMPGVLANHLTSGSMPGILFYTNDPMTISYVGSPLTWGVGQSKVYESCVPTEHDPYSTVLGSVSPTLPARVAFNPMPRLQKYIYIYIYIYIYRSFSDANVDFHDYFTPC